MSEQTTSVYDLPINTRAKISLDLYGIKTMEELKLITPEELRQIPGIGVKSVQEIAAAVEVNRIDGA